jgi:hypothetical protein
MAKNSNKKATRAIDNLFYSRGLVKPIGENKLGHTYLLDNNKMDCKKRKIRTLT